MSISEQSLTPEKVTILMGVRNGAAHLAAQLDSIATQTHANWQLICSDDGSRDGTREIIQDFANQHAQRVHLIDGPQQGFSVNFMKMIADLPDDAGLVSFADQDDIWEPDKIARAVLRLRRTDAMPRLYSSRCWYWYPNLDRRIASPSPLRPPSFRNALIENIATGNTIVLNTAAAQLARIAAQRTGDVFAHDWWLYLLITGVGGEVHFDTDAPSLLYRQHQGNAIGAGQGVSAQMSRKVKVLQGAFAERIAGNLAALDGIRDLLSAENAAALDGFAQARHAGLVQRLAGLRRVGLYRQTALGDLGFWGAACLGRV